LKFGANAVSLAPMESNEKDISGLIPDTNQGENVYLQCLKPSPKTKFLESLSYRQREVIESYLKSGNVSIDNGDNAVNIAVWMKTDPNFNKAVTFVREILDKVELMTLEAVSTVTAKNPKSTVERIFRLKSLNRKRYADRGRVNSNGIDITINFGSGITPYANGAVDIGNVSTVTTPTGSKKLRDVVSSV